MIAVVALSVPGQGRVVRCVLTGRGAGSVLHRRGRMFRRGGVVRHGGVVRRAGAHVAMKRDHLGPRQGQKTKESYGPVHRERLAGGLPGVKQVTSPQSQPSKLW